MANPYTSEVPLPALREHFATALVSYPNMTAGNAAIEQECALDPAMAELRQHLLRHRITFCVFDSKYAVVCSHTTLRHALRYTTLLSLVVLVQ